MADEQECTYEVRDGDAILANSKIEIRLDRNSGAVTGLVNKTSGVAFIRPGEGEVFRLVHCRWDLHGAQSKDPFSAAYGTLVNSRRQQVTEMAFQRIPGGARLEVRYAPLRLERRTIDVRVRYSIEISDTGEETRWRLMIENNDPGTIREAHFPFLSGVERFDALLMPDQAGQKLSDPLDKLSDEISQICLEYPARASMQWFDYGSASAGLYMASYDQDLHYTRLCFGRVEGKMHAAVWVEKYPFAVNGTRWDSPVIAVGPHAGDWHWGADQYRRWTETWMEKPRVPRRVREMISGCDEFFIKKPDESLVNRYEDIPHITEKNRDRPGARLFMAVGWFTNGHDTFYPEYGAIEELGGEQALVKAMDQAREMHTSVNAYVNGRLASIDTETYHKYGKKWAVLTKGPGLGVTEIEFGELHENWNRAWERDKRSEGWFAVMCPFVKEWQDHLVAQCTKVIRDYHFDGIFLDQPASYWAELCYNKNHGHSTPASAWGPGYLEIFRRVREAMRAENPDSVLFTEGLNDAYGQYLDYHMDKNPAWEPMRIHPEAETFVEMWRYTLPGQVVINGAGTYSYPPSHDPVYGESYHFVLGVRGQVSLDGEAVGPVNEKEAEEHRAVLEKIERLWTAGSQTLFYGRFMDDIGLHITPLDVLGKAYLGKNELAVPLWNTSPAVTTTRVTVDLQALGLPALEKGEAISLDTGSPLPYIQRGGQVEITLDLRPHDIDIIVLR